MGTRTTHWHALPTPINEHRMPTLALVPITLSHTCTCMFRGKINSDQYMYVTKTQIPKLRTGEKEVLQEEGEEGAAQHHTRKANCQPKHM